MPTIKAFITKHAVATYFALTFAISWGGVLAVAGPKIPATREEFERLLPSVVVMMLAGPSFAGILLTGLVYGRAGLRELRSRLLKWRVGARWYAAALLIAPALMTALLLGLSLFSPEFLPGIVVSADKTVFLLSGFAIALGAGIFEELGWTGFRGQHGTCLGPFWQGALFPERSPWPVTCSILSYCWSPSGCSWCGCTTTPRACSSES
jgi:CAAX protease family protein